MKSREGASEIFEKARKAAEGRLSWVGLEVGDLIGKRVLDLGSGKSAVGEYLTAIGVDCVSLDLDVSDLGKYGSEGRAQADALKLPFANEAFDYVISTLGPPMMVGTGVRGSAFLFVPSREDYRALARELTATTAEVKRILKPEGEFRISPPFLQLVLADKYQRIQDLPGEACREEWDKVVAEATDRSIVLYERHGFPEVKLYGNKQEGYLTWVKPIGEKN